MGRAMKNLDRLLAMPYGCGEQNMVLFAPNIFILNYLKSTGQLTPDIQEKATRFLESGEFRRGWLALALASVTLTLFCWWLAQGTRGSSPTSTTTAPTAPSARATSPGTPGG